MIEEADVVAFTPKGMAKRMRALELALAHAREVADAERRAAQRAREAADRAWRLVAWGGPRRPTEQPPA